MRGRIIVGSLLLMATTVVVQAQRVTPGPPASLTPENKRAMLIGRARAIFFVLSHSRYYSAPNVLLLVTDDLQEINAFADVANKQIVISQATIEFFLRDPGELAWLLAHELGHIQDSGCNLRGMQQGLTGTGLSRMCEAAADEIAIQYMMAAGYSPYDAAAAMGRFMMLPSGQSTVFSTIVGRFLSDHPVSMDRIVHSRDIAIRTCRERPDVCAQFKVAPGTQP